MFNTISGEDYQLVQIEVFFYRFEHQRYRDLPAATIGEFEFCSQNLFVSDDSHDKQSQFFLTTDRECNLCCFGVFRSLDR